MAIPKLNTVTQPGFGLSELKIKGTVDELKAHVAKVDSQPLFWHVLPAQNPADVKMVAMGMDKQAHYCITDYLD